MAWRHILWTWQSTCVVLTAAAASSEDGNELFEKRIRPVLVEHCYSCHSAGAKKLKADLRLDSREGALRGGDTGPAMIPGHARESRLFRALKYEDPDLQMPPKSRLPPDIVSDFGRWIDLGAPWPGEGENLQVAQAPHFDLQDRKSRHWAWNSIRRPEAPQVHDLHWPASELDRFILAALERSGLQPARPAERRVLIRRASFILTGLPPTPDEVKSFVADASPRAFERVVDRLLDSPHFGERWARHWLDKVRYAETLGHEFDYSIPDAWRYRDYVVSAFNLDLPYNEFAREQIAGDLLPYHRRNTKDGTDQSLVATEQFWFGQQVHSPVDVRNHQIELIDNQIDVVTKAFLGLTVSCARCHDHKFDAISTRDYYAMFGILSSSRYAIRAIDDPRHRLDQAAELRDLRDRIRSDLADQVLARIDSGTAAMPSISALQQRPSEDRSLPVEGWFVDGEAFGADPLSAGQPCLFDSGVARIVIPGWRHSGSLSRRFQGALRSPTFTIDRDYLHLRLAGKGARFSVVLEGFTLIRSPIYGALRQAVANEEAHWVSIDVSMWKGRRGWLEFADLSQPDPATTLPAEAMSADGWIAVGEVIASTLRDPPGTESMVPPVNPRDVLRKWRVSPEELTVCEGLWLEQALRDAKLQPSANLLKAWSQVEDSIRAPVLAGVMAEGTGLDEPVFIRGNYRTHGEPVHRGFLEAMETSNAADFSQGSGRLGLAYAITAPENPLFARVMVNWVWSHVFGQGLVASVDNLGVLGSAPSHPELLDWLADEFRREQWSTKRLIRQMMLSKTWQMSSRPNDNGAEEKDPGNRLMHRANPSRLEGEAIRDAMLAVSGRLEPTMGGPSVPLHLTRFMEGRGRPEVDGPTDGAGRRSLYLEVRRNFLSPWMLAFDSPVPATTVGRRTISNVPSQALALMNDPFVNDQARLWAQRVERESSTPSIADRVERLFQSAFARSPAPNEVIATTAFLEGLHSHGDEENLAALTDLCHALFNSKEFVFIE